MHLRINSLVSWTGTEIRATAAVSLGFTGCDKQKCTASPKSASASSMVVSLKGREASAGAVQSRTSAERGV